MTVVPLLAIDQFETVTRAPAVIASSPPAKATVPAPDSVPAKLLPLPVKVRVSPFVVDSVPPVWVHVPA